VGLALGLVLGVRVLRARAARAQAVAEHRTALVQAEKDLERATRSGDLRAVTGALDVAERAGAAVAADVAASPDAAPEPRALDPVLRERAALALCERALEAGTRLAADRALERAGALPEPYHEPGRALLLLARLRLRAGADAADLVARLRPLDGPGGDLLEAQVALVRGDAAAAVPLLERAQADPAHGALAQDLRVEALARLGKDGAALEAAGGAPSALVRFARVVTARAVALAAPTQADLDPAFDALVRAARTGDPRAVEALLALAKSTGRASEACDVLDPLAADANADRRVVDAAARARALAGREGPDIDPVLAADLAAVGSDDDPYHHPAWSGGGEEEDLLVAAASARFEATRPGGVRELARRAEGLFSDRRGPADVPPSPREARALRDLAWAADALGDSKDADALLQDALRGLPFDLDALTLLARRDRAAWPRLRAALRLELGELDGPLARGLLLARVAELWPESAVSAEARALLEARLAGDPAVWPAAWARARLLGQPPPQDALPWLEWLDLVPDPPAPAPEDRQEAMRLATAPRDDLVKIAEGYRRACAIDPSCVRARWELAIVRGEIEAGSTDAALEWARYARLRPNTAIRLAQHLRQLWEVVGASSPRVDVERARALDPRSPMNELPRIVDETYGVLYPDETHPTFTRAPPLETRRRLDALVARDPRLVGFLVLRAQLSEALGRPGAADRDLALLERAFAGEKDARDDKGDAFWVKLAHVAVCAARRPRVALDVVRSLPLPLPVDSADVGDLSNWLHRDPVFAPLRDEPEWKELLARFRP
jgi:hypothetical protein